MGTVTKVAIILLALVGLGTALFVYNIGTSGTVKLPSWFTTGSSSPFSFAPGRSGIVGPATPQGPATGQGGQGQTTIAAPPSTSITVDLSMINPTEIPAGFTAAQLSPYFHEVRFGGVSAGGFYNYGTITLNTYFKNPAATGTIDITGWQIKTRNSGEYIPQAINLYDPSGLVAPSDIRMRNGDMASLYSSSAPFNLRLNKCVGYIAHVANFQPALPMNCPYTDRSAISGFTGACQNYINTLGGCQQPNMSNPQIPRNDYACQNYLNNNFTYTSCFQQHAGDADFLSNQVWVWTGGNVVDPSHDIVNLLDGNGKLVDQYSY